MAASSFVLKRVSSSSSSSFFFKFLNPAARSISGGVARRSFKSSAPFKNDDVRFHRSTDCRESVKEELTVTSRGLVGIKKEEGYEMRQDFENLYVIKELPVGSGKEDVKISMEGDVLTVKGEGVNESGEDDGFILQLFLCSSLYHHHKIEAHVKNGVLEMVIPFQR